MRFPAAEEAIRAGELPTWLLRLTLPSGEVMLFSTAAIDIPVRGSLTPGPYQPIPLLTDVRDFTEELDLFSLDGVGALTQARVSLAWHASIAAMQADWMHVAAATAEVSVIWQGQAWEDRFKLLTAGAVQGVEFGIAGETTTLVLETTPPRTSATVGDDTRDLGDDWSGVTDDLGGTMSDLSGRKYQRVYGTPLSVPGYKTGEMGATGDNILVLAGHHFADLTNIRVYEDGVWKGVFTPVNGTVGGEDYCYVLDATEFRSTDGAYTFWPEYGGIAAANDLTAPATSAGDILRKLLDESGLDVNWGRMEATIQALSSWSYGFYVDKEATAIDIIRDKMVRYLPIVEMNDSDGIWFAFIDPWSAPIEAELVVGQNLLGRVGRMTLSDLEAIENKVTINHSFDAGTNVYNGTATLDADTSTLCFLSQQLYGERAPEVVACKTIQDATTAEKYLAQRIARNALPRRRVTYLAPLDLYWLRAGMVVAIIDEELGIPRSRAIIKTVDRSHNPFHISVELVDRTPVARLS